MAEEREITIKLTAKNLTGAEFAKARAELSGLKHDADKTASAGVGMGAGFKTAAAGVLGMVGGAAILGTLRAGIGSIVGGAIDMNSTLEKSTLQFGTLMGDSGKAEAHVKSLFEFAKRTPFETGPIIQASRMMQTFGGDALNTKRNLELIGDASAATGAPIEDLGFWVGRMYANLKAGQPFGEAAARLQELAVLTPSARAEMEALQKAGKSGEEVFGVFQTRLGDFSGAMVAQAGTWEGLKSSISDAVSIMMADALKPLFDLVKTGARIVLEALGSEGMAGAFESAKATIGVAFGSGSDGGAGIIKTFVTVLATGIDLSLAALGLFGQAISGIRVVFYAAALGIITSVDNIVKGFGAVASAAEKLPGVGDKFRGVAAGIQAASDFTGSLRSGFEDLTREAVEGAKGNDTWGRSIAGARTVVQALRTEIENATVAQTTSTAATRAAGPAKAEFAAKTKAEEKALKDAEKAAKDFTESVTGMSRAWGEFRPTLADAGAAIRNISAGLTEEGTLVSRTTQETGALRAESLEWARVNSAVLAPSIQQVTSALVTSTTGAGGFKSALGAAFKDLSGVMLSAIQGGGNVGKAAGAHLGGSLGEWAGKAAGPMLGSVLGKGLGGSVASMFGPVGTMIGGFLGEKIGGVASKVMGGIFKSEGKKVNNLRDDFVAAAGGIGELDAKAHAAGLTLDRLLKAKNVKDYQAAIDELNAAFGQAEADTELARQAMEEWGITASEAGQKFAQADMDKTAGAMLAKLKAATAAGVDLNAIVSKGGDDFGKMVHQAIKTGTTISNEFRPVLAAMIENKSLVDENGEAFTDLSQIPFAEDIGSAIRDGIGTPIRELVDFFKSGVFGAFKAAGDVGVDFGSRVAGSIARIPRSIEIEVNGTYNPPDITGGSQGYRVGTYGVHGTDFVNFAESGEVVEVHGREAIVPEAGAPRFVADYLKRHGVGTAGGATSVAATVNVYTLTEVHGDQASTRRISETEYERRKINAMGRAGLIALPARAVVGT